MTEAERSYCIAKANCEAIEDELQKARIAYISSKERVNSLEAKRLFFLNMLIDIEKAIDREKIQ